MFRKGQTFPPITRMELRAKRREEKAGCVPERDTYTSPLPLLLCRCGLGHEGAPFFTPRQPTPSGGGKVNNNTLPPQSVFVLRLLYHIERLLLVIVRLILRRQVLLARQHLLLLLIRLSDCSWLRAAQLRPPPILLSDCSRLYLG